MSGRSWQCVACHLSYCAPEKKRVIVCAWCLRQMREVGEARTSLGLKFAEARDGWMNAPCKDALARDINGVICDPCEPVATRSPLGWIFYVFREHEGSIDAVVSVFEDALKDNGVCELDEIDDFVCEHAARVGRLEKHHWDATIANLDEGAAQLVFS